MLVRSFVKRSLDIKKKLFIILVSISVGAGVGAVLLNGESSVYRDEFYIPLNPYDETRQVLNIHTAGMPLEVAVHNGEGIKVVCVAESPLIIDNEQENEISIIQDDGFAVSLFTLDMFRYKLRVYLPRGVEFREINIVSVGGNIDIDSHSIRAGRVNIATKSGRVSVLRAVSVYSINTGSGDVVMDFDRLEALAAIESRSGNVSVRVPDYEMYNVDSRLRIDTSGEVEIIEKDMSLPENIPVL
jgi:hypothetical protein